MSISIIESSEAITKLSAQFSSITSRKRYYPDGEFKTSSYRTGRWSDQEIKLFDEAILIHGNNWRAIQAYIPTRTRDQIRSHAQKALPKHTPSHFISEHSMAIKFDQYHLTEFDSLFLAIIQEISLLSQMVLGNRNYSRVEYMIHEILENYDRLRVVGRRMDLSEIALGKMSRLSLEIDNITKWHQYIRSTHQEFMQFRYMYGILCYDIVDIAEFNFFNIICRRQTNTKYAQYNGFQKWNYVNM